MSNGNESGRIEQGLTQVQKIVFAGLGVSIAIAALIIYSVMFKNNIYINTHPEGTKVVLNGSVRGVTPFKERIDPGGYKMKLIADGYVTFEKVIQISHENVFTYFHEMVDKTKAQSTGCYGYIIGGRCWDSKPSPDPLVWNTAYHYCKARGKKLPNKAAIQGTWYTLRKKIATKGNWGIWTSDEDSDPTQAWLYIPNKGYSKLAPKSIQGLILCVR